MVKRSAIPMARLFQKKVAPRMMNIDTSANFICAPVNISEPFPTALTAGGNASVEFAVTCDVPGI